MKKIKYLVLVLSLVLLTGCSKKMTCTSTSDQSKSGYKLESKYEITTNNNNVTKVEIEETITSSDKKKLEKFEKQLDEQYSYNKKKYGGYTYKVTNSNGKVTSKVTIDYKKFDMKQFIKDNAAMKTYTKDDKLTLDGAKKLYESTGATCK